MKILMIVGSMRKDSFNLQLALQAKNYLEDKVDVSFLEYKDIPYMNQDLETVIPDEIKRIREEVSSADGIWFFTPEYNHSYPGVLKNVLDWLSRPVIPNDFSSGTAIAQKKATISGCAGKSAALYSRTMLKELLGFIRVDVMDLQTGVSLSSESFKTGKLSLSEDNKKELEQQANAFIAFLGR
ncbi:MAG: NAD(P)H-dependent oxidoreductase [Holdemanella sp.]|nr:NAD(P)H-dependent oxidoreductase [Holdemanella sp.]